MPKNRCSEVHKKYGETKPNRSQELLICLLPSLPADVLWGSFVTHSDFRQTNPKGRLRGGYLLPGVSFVIDQLGFVSVELPCGLFNRHKKCYVDLLLRT